MALTLVTSDLIHGLDYSKLTGTIPTWNQNTTGNAATATLAAGATILATARNIGGVSFNGSAAIDLPGVNTAGNQNTSGTAAGLSATLVVGSGGTGVTSITALKNVLDDETWTFANNATFSGNVGIGGSPSVSLEIAKSGARIKLIDGTNQLNMGLWDGSNYRIEGDANRKILITSYHSDGIHLGGSGNSHLVVKGGNVGIGTTSPNYLLDLQSSETGLTHNLKLNKGSATGDYAEIAFQLWNGAGSGLNTFGGSGTSRPSVVLRAINEASSSAAGAFVVGTFTGGANNSTLTEKFRISSGGLVGIGKTPDLKILDLQSTSGLALRFYNSTAFKAGIEVATTNGDMIGTSVVNDLAIRSQSNILFSTGGNTERMRISSGGDVNIGTADGLPLMHGSVAGNASYCTYSFVNDPNTGMIRTGADTLALVTAASPRLTIFSGGDMFNNYDVMSSANPTYRQSFWGGLSFLYRNAVDSYINSNHTYNSANQNIASYNATQGIGRLEIVGGDLNWKTYEGTVTAGSNYALTSKFYISSGGDVSVNNKFSQNSVGRRCNSGYTSGNSSFFIDYTVTSQSSLKVTAVFNHYGLIPNYGCARFSLVGMGPNITAVEYKYNNLW